ncbi:MAG: B-box zinc finger protein [Kiritimatiellae bacterium]|nr:B-box zinc finger protein [Kiritimatiellia bacterium]
MAASICCMRCRAPLAVSAVGDGKHGVTCGRCGTMAFVRVYPAIYRQNENRQTSVRAVPGDATCFNHPDKQASSVCDACGRLLCGLCRIDFNERIVCAACLNRERQLVRKRGKGFEAQRVRYDQIALLAALLSPMLWFVSFIVAVFILYLTIRHWRTELSLLPYNRWRLVVASLLAVGILAAWIAIPTMVISRLHP